MRKCKRFSSKIKTTNLRSVLVNINKTVEQYARERMKIRFDILLK